MKTRHDKRRQNATKHDKMLLPQNNGSPTKLQPTTRRSKITFQFLPLDGPVLAFAAVKRTRKIHTRSRGQRHVYVSRSSKFERFVRHGEVGDGHLHWNVVTFPVGAETPSHRRCIELRETVVDQRTLESDTHLSRLETLMLMK